MLMVDHYSTTYVQKTTFVQNAVSPSLCDEDQSFLRFLVFFTEYVASLIFSKTKTNYRSYSGRRAVEVI